MVSRRKLPVALADARVAPLAGTVVEDGIEEHERVALRRDLQVVGGIVEPGHKRGEGREVSAGRAAGGGDARWIDAEFGGVRAHVAQR